MGWNLAEVAETRLLGVGGTFRTHLGEWGKQRKRLAVSLLLVLMAFLAPLRKLGLP